MEQSGSEIETRPAVPVSVSAAPVSDTNTHTNATNTDTGHNAPAPGYSMSTLALIPGLGLPSKYDHQSGVNTNGDRERGGDSAPGIASPASTSVPLIHQRQPLQLQQQPYVPQFSAATSLILNRIKGGDKDFNSALVAASAAVPRPDKVAFEEAKMRLIEKMNATQSSPPTAEPSNSAQSQGQSHVQSPAEAQSQNDDQTQGGDENHNVLLETGGSDVASQKGTKRKREMGEDGGRDERTTREPVDFTQSTMPFPYQESKSPAVPALTPAIEGICVKCGSSSSIPSNVLVACARCNIVCHQACFSPMPATATTSDHDSTRDAPSDQSLLLCPSCNKGQPLNDAQVQPEPLRRKQKIERIRQMRLAALPDGAVPAKPELVGFGPGAASDRARVEYFSNMTKTDALNLLSFCDQLRPQLLIDVMVSVSKRHPDLLMFNSPDWNTIDSRSAGAAASSSSRAAAAAAAAAATAAHASRKAAVPAGRPPHGRSLLNSKAKQKIKPSSANGSGNSVATKQQHPVLKRPTKRVQQQHPPVGDAARNAAAAVPVNRDEVDVDEDAPPPTWPKAGEGLYVKLAPEINDRLFLADENDEEAFSHFMVDKMGRQIIDPV